MYEIAMVAAIWLAFCALIQWLGRVKGRGELHSKLNARRAQLQREFEESCR